MAVMRAFRRRLWLIRRSPGSGLVMSDHSRDSPRRYFVDGSGQRVLVGLTIEETSEFETLDGHAAIDNGRGQVLWDASDQPGPSRHGRWLELYAKHEQAWSQWMANTRANRHGSLPIVN
jgi:hypothetical protein